MSRTFNIYRVERTHTGKSGWFQSGAPYAEEHLELARNHAKKLKEGGAQVRLMKRSITEREIAI